jgi:hypothetical protein
MGVRQPRVLYCDEVIFVHEYDVRVNGWAKTTRRDSRGSVGVRQLEVLYCDEVIFVHERDVRANGKS